MKKNYEHIGQEDAIYSSWMQSGSMRANAKSGKDSFVIPLPPPNVTGKLHLGHAAMLAIEDILIRYNKMRGAEALWIPGTDHAAIATENVVIKHLGLKSREELSREEFLDECRTFATDKHDTIVNQIKKMGAWLDWSREAYTFDEERNFAVNKIFKQLFEDGLIVRGHRMINWSTGAQSVLADDELEWEEKKAPFYYIKCGPFAIGTVRSETKCSDSPVIVNPHGTYLRLREKETNEELILSEFAWESLPIFVSFHETYEVVEKVVGRDLVGQKFEYQTYAGLRRFWVIADNVIDMEKGTGAMTISAAHSEDDYELATRLNLKELFFQKIDLEGKMTDIAGTCEGMSVIEARKASAKIMKEQGLLLAVDHNYVNRIPLCYRSNCVVEPMISQQWFVSVEKEFEDKWTGEKTTLKKLTQEAVREEHVKIIPERFEKIYFQWIDNLRDWCISRQIWWGHRIPVWYDQDQQTYLGEEKHIYFARHGESEGNVQDIYQGIQDFPLSTLGKEQAADLGEKMKAEGIEKIICSDLSRAQETASIIADICGAEVEVWEDLKEMHLGSLDGKPLQPLRDQGKTPHHIMMEEGKTEEMYQRAQDIWKRLKSSNLPDKTLVVSHGGLLKVLFAVHKAVTPDNFLSFRSHFSYANCEVKKVGIFTAPNKEGLTQDEDTLDTWFSSALWPFSTLGWPNEEADDFQKFYPNDVLETGHDILFFWVARMIMFGRYATGKYPYHTVYLHGLVCDEHGKKMSKSKGNGIDPLDVIEEYGADSVRLSLVIGTSPGNPIPLGKSKISGYRNFVNKLWNAGRFVQMQLERADEVFDLEEKPSPTSLADQWILSRFSMVSDQIKKSLDDYQISQAGDVIYHFVWDEFCDWYLEAQKAKSNPKFLAWIYSEILALVHPLCPFVTENIYQQFTGSDCSLINRDYPASDFNDSNAVSSFGLLQEIVTQIRKVRADKSVPPKDRIEVVVSAGKMKVLLDPGIEVLKTLAGLSSVVIESEIDRPDGSSMALVEGVEVYVIIPFDVVSEKKRLQKLLMQLDKQISGLEGRLGNPSYTEKAPAHLVQQTQDQLTQAQSERSKVQAELESL